MLKKNSVIALVIGVMGLFAALGIVAYQPNSTLQAEENEPVIPRGPHQGRLFRDKDLTLELLMYETDIPPEFHIWFWRDGKAVPVEEVDLRTQVHRLGQVDTLTYRKEKDYLLSNQTIVEPHSFEVVFQGKYNNQHYQWRFKQEEGRITIPAPLLKRSNIQILRAGSQVLSQHLSLPGQVVLDQDRYVHVSPPITGRALEVYKHVGERVSKGELLAVIHSPELADLRLQQQQLEQKYARARLILNREEQLSQNTRRLLQFLRQGQEPESIHRQMLQSPVGENKSLLVSAFADLRLARQNLQREQGLHRDKIASTESVQIAQTNYDNALSRYLASVEESSWQRESELLLKRQDLQAIQAEQRALAQKLDVLHVSPHSGVSARYELRSPITGVVTEKHLAIGEALRGADPVFVIANLSEVWVELQLPDTQLDEIRQGQKVNVVSQDGKRTATGTIAHISPVIDTETRRAEAEVHVQNPTGYWRPGMFVNAEVVTRQQRVPLAVSKAALQRYNDWDVVYAQFGDVFEVRPLVLGQEGQDWVEVKSGLKPGQPYAASNSFIIKAEIGKKAARHDH